MSRDRLIQDAYDDFLLSRKAALRTQSTLEFYHHTLGRFVKWVPVDDPKDLSARHVRQFLSTLAESRLTDSTLHAHARSIRAFCRFLLAEEYIGRPIQFEMPHMAKRIMPRLSLEQVQRLIQASRNAKERAVVLTLLDSGLRRSEVCNLRWADVNLETGIILVRSGKGRKDRLAVVGVKTRRALLKWRRQTRHEAQDTVFFLKPSGLRGLLRRLGDRAGFRASPHMFRRSFASLSHAGGMDLISLQALMGHASLEQTRAYVNAATATLLAAHERAGPVDRLT